MNLKSACRSGLFCAVAAAALTYGQGVFAQSATGQTATAEVNTVEAIVVTAQRRSENVKDVPVSISSVSGSDLGLRHIANYDDLTRAVPSVSFAAGGGGNGVGEGLSIIEMRGISSTVGQATVGVYLDDTSLTVTNRYDGTSQPLPFDIGRVEVLRGPQGTLYGASSMGGAIRFLTNTPKMDVFEANLTSDLSGTVHGGLNYEEGVVLNLPVIEDKLAVRLGVDFGSTSGYIDHYNSAGALVQKGVDQDWHGVVKLSAVFKPSADWTITPSIWLQQVNSRDSPVFYPAVGLYKQTKFVNEPSNDRMAIPSLTIVKDVGFADLTSVSSYFFRNEARQTDGTYFNDTAFAQFFLDSTPPFTAHQAENDSIIANIPSPVNWSTRYQQESQELRLVSHKPGPDALPLKWTAGVYYSHQMVHHANDEYSPGLNNAFTSIYGYSLSDPIVQSALGTSADTFANDLIFLQTSIEEMTQYSGFGQVDYDILPKLHGSVGLRYVYADTSIFAATKGFYGIAIAPTYRATASFADTTPKFSLTYDLTNAATVYGTISKGFRLGGGNTPDPAGAGNVCTNDYASLGVTGAPTKYDSDHLWSYEIGSKALVADRSISLNSAIYYIKWTNIQQTIVLPTCGFNFTGNFGDAESYGGEFELQYKPKFLPHLTVGLNGSVGKSVITRSSNPDVAQVGEHVLFTPDWTLSANAEYHWYIMDNLKAFVRGDYEYTGNSHGSYQVTNPNFNNPGYGVLNGSMGLEKGSWQTYLYAKNLANDQTIIQRPQINNIIEGYTARPLTIGVMLSKQY